MVSNSSGGFELEVHQIKHLYNDRAALDIAELSFQKGKIYGLAGSNGAGKSTLMLILSLLLKPSSGRVLFRGVEVTDGNRRDLRGRISMLLQDPLLFRNTVARNVEYGLRIRRIARTERKKRVMKSLEMMGLEDFADRKARELSGGEAQRVAIARALAIQPEILLLDELTANVDEGNVKIVEEIVRSLSRESGATVIFSTHDKDQAHRLADETIILLEGRITPFSPENIFKGKTIRDGEGTWFDTGRIRVFLPNGEEARAISISPEEIVVSLSPFNSSAQNRVEGTIESMVVDGDGVRLLINAPEQFHVLITKKSLCELNLNVGMRVYLTFKSTAVKVF